MTSTVWLLKLIKFWIISHFWVVMKSHFLIFEFFLLESKICESSNFKVNFVVIATMRGHKAKSTNVVLGEEASTVDFILDPLITLEDGVLLRDCDCCFRKSPLKLTEILRSQDLHFFLVLMFILVFLCFLMKRKAILAHLKQKQIIGPKRPLVVWHVLYVHWGFFMSNYQMIFMLYPIHSLILSGC